MSNYKVTKDVLVSLSKAGYHMVTIGKPDVNNPACRSWMNGPFSIWAWHPSFGDSHHNKTTTTCRIGGWPAVWEICRKHGIKNSCGNGHQRQIARDENLVEGTFDVTSVENLTKNLNDKFNDSFCDAL